MSSPALRARSWPAAVLVLFCLVAGIPAVVALTPDQGVTVFGQYVRVGARPPDLSPVGPAQVVQVGNTTLDVERVQVWGPLRPRLTLGPVQRNAAAQAVFDPEAAQRLGERAVESVTRAFVLWYALAGAGLLLFTVVASLGAAGLRTLLVLRRESRAAPTADGVAGHAPLADILRFCVRSGRRMTAAALVAVVLAWGAAGVLAHAGASAGLRSVASLSQLVGARPLTPDPVGPPVEGFTGAVIGDSRVSRLGGPPLPDGSPQDAACGRSTDSLAAQLDRLRGERVLNLACPSATVTTGLRGPQVVGDVVVPPQVGLLKQVRDLDWVVVAIGPNDVAWTDFLLYCYGAADCADNLSQGEFDYRLAAFDSVFSDLLVDLNDLPGRPRVVVMTSYEPFPATARGDSPCGDVRGPAGYPGLDEGKIALLRERTRELDEVLAAGARAYGFAVAEPPLRPLCAGPGRGEPGPDGLGPDLQGLGDPFPFHPTGVGTLRMAAGVSALLAADAS
jgi:hypothetical protein